MQDTRCRVQISAQPLAADANNLIDKETPKKANIEQGILNQEVKILSQNADNLQTKGLKLQNLTLPSVLTPDTRHLKTLIGFAESHTR